MAFFISYPLSALGHDINPRADRSDIYERYDMKMTCYDLLNT